jgi:hypothetical protein
MRREATLAGRAAGAAILLLSITSCGSDERVGSPAPESKRMELDSTSQYYDENYKIYTLEGCEYIVVGYGNTRWGSHKGDCKNPVHRRDSQPQEYAVEDIMMEEKHFDCRVEECSKGTDGKWMVFTECGIYFESKTPYKQGEVLRNFQSPKHK